MQCENTLLQGSSCIGEIACLQGTETMNGISRAYRPDLDALQARFALRVTAGLSEQSDALPHDIGERLRVAREQAVARARQTRRAARAWCLSYCCRWPHPRPPRKRRHDCTRPRHPCGR